MVESHFPSGFDVPSGSVMNQGARRDIEGYNKGDLFIRREGQSAFIDGFEGEKDEGEFGSIFFLPLFLSFLSLFSLHAYIHCTHHVHDKRTYMHVI